MAPKRKKSVKSKGVWIFPLLFLLTPFIAFGFDGLYRYFAGGDISVKIYFYNFTLLYEQFRLIDTYIAPAIAFVILCAVTVLLANINKNKLSLRLWIVLSVIGFVLLLFGYRVLFYFTHTYLEGDVLVFLLNGVSLYTVTLSIMVDFLVCSAAKFFDVGILK